MIRHQAVTQHSKTLKLGVVPQQLQISGAIAVAAEDDLPGVATLGNMVGNIGHDNTREAGHG